MKREESDELVGGCISNCQRQKVLSVYLGICFVLTVARFIKQRTKQVRPTTTTVSNHASSTKEESSIMIGFEVFLLPSLIL